MAIGYGQSLFDLKDSVAGHRKMIARLEARASQLEARASQLPWGTPRRRPRGPRQWEKLLEHGMRWTGWTPWRAGAGRKRRRVAPDVIVEVEIIGGIRKIEGFPGSTEGVDRRSAALAARCDQNIEVVFDLAGIGRVPR